MSSNFLKLNAEKTHFAWFGTRQQLLKVNTHSLSNGNASTNIDRVAVDLGVTLDSELSMQPHFRSCAKTGFYQLRQLWSVRRSLSTDVAKALAHAFISSRIDYCNSSFYGATAKNLCYLQSILHGAACMVLRRRKFDHISSGTCDELHWLPVVQRINFKICLLTYKCLHNMAPLYLANLCPG